MAQLYYGDTPLSQMPASYPASRVTHESVSVTADGVKTYGQILDELYALVDKTKITIDSKLVIKDTQVYQMNGLTSVSCSFGRYSVPVGEAYITFISLPNNGGAVFRQMQVSNQTYSDLTNAVTTNGEKFYFYY